MKHGNSYFIQFPRSIQSEDYRQKMSDSAFRMYAWLLELEAQFSGNKGGFYRTNEQLVKDLCKNINTVKKAKRELLDLGLIKVRKQSIDLASGEKTQEHVTFYNVLRPEEKQETDKPILK